jgi:hypothetical protein
MFDDVDVCHPARPDDEVSYVYYSTEAAAGDTVQPFPSPSFSTLGPFQDIKALSGIRPSLWHEDIERGHNHHRCSRLPRRLRTTPRSIDMSLTKLGKE